MAQEWAINFYRSKEWLHVRQAYLASRLYLCERCGKPAKIVHHIRHLNRQNIHNPAIALSSANLQALCQDCHNAIHNSGKARKVIFDADGFPVGIQEH